jgi:hypothetical protein
MQPDAIRFKLASNADIIVSQKGVTYRWMDFDGRVRKENIGGTSVGRLMARQLSGGRGRCAKDGTPYPPDFWQWSNGKRLVSTPNSVVTPFSLAVLS